MAAVVEKYVFGLIGAAIGALIALVWAQGA
jgi:hypothetical protein